MYKKGTLDVSDLQLRALVDEDGMEIYLDAYQLNEVLYSSECPMTLELFLNQLNEVDPLGFVLSEQTEKLKLKEIDNSSWLDIDTAISFLMFKSYYEANTVALSIMMYLASAGVALCIEY